MLGRWIGPAAILLGVALAPCSPRSHAAGLVDPVDPTFGIVKMTTPESGSGFIGMNVAADGRVLVLGYRQIASTYSPCYSAYIVALRPDGTRDPAFGQLGFLDTGSVGIGCIEPQFSGFTLDSVGRIVITYYQYPSPSPQYVRRLDAQGRGDATFGSQGVAVLPGGVYVRFPTLRAAENGAIIAYGVAVTPGVSENASAFRLAGSGLPDPGFGNAGVVTVSLPSEVPGVDGDLAVGADGKLTLAWNRVVRDAAGISHYEPVIARLLASGAHDPAFGTGGRIAGLPDGFAVEALTLTSGGVVAAMRDFNTDARPYSLHGFDASGQADLAFGTAGAQDVAGNEDTNRAFLRLATDPASRVLGIVLEGFGYRVLRWQANGQPDAGFGAGGSAVIVVSSGSYLYGRAPSIATSNVGAIYAGFDLATAAVARVLPDGGRTAGVTRAVAIGYYNATLRHYFMTADPEEQRLLDTGAFQGWQRSGPAWTVVAPGSGQSVLSPVCRYYGRPEAGLDSHFYSASPFECGEVERLFAASWQKESDDVYEVYLPNPTSGACAPRSRPIYRYFNGRVDANHLFTPTPLPFVPQGWTIEGYGPLPLPVAMCAPIL